MGSSASREREVLSWSKEQLASSVLASGFGHGSETVSSALLARGVDGRVLVDLMKMDDLSLENWCLGFETAAQRRDILIFFRILGKLKNRRNEPPDKALVEFSDKSTVNIVPTNSRHEGVSEFPFNSDDRVETTNSTSSNSPSSGETEGGGRRESNAASSAMDFESGTDFEAYTDSMANSSVISSILGTSDKGTPPLSPTKDDFIDLDDNEDEVAKKRREDVLVAIATIDAAIMKDEENKDKDAVKESAKEIGGMPPTISMSSPTVAPVLDTAMRAHATIQRERRNQPFPTLGVKVSWLRVFVNENGGENRFRGLTTGDVCREIIRPAVLRHNITYAQLVKETQPAVPDGVINKPFMKKQAKTLGSDDEDSTDSEDENREDQVLKQNVDEAQVMISHSWQNEFLSTVAALENHFKDQPELHLWIDLFSVDQTYTTQPLPPALDDKESVSLAGVEFQASTHGMDYKWWSLTYKSAIGHFGGVVLVMSPWKEPLVLGSAWNLFELYCSCTIPFTEFEVAMTKEDSNTFIDEISNSHQAYFSMLNNKVDMLKATTFHKSDKERIFEFIDKEVDGKFEAVNRVCCNKLKEWVMLTIESNVSARAEEAAAKMRHAAKVASMTAVMAAKANDKRALIEKRNNADKVMRKADMLHEQQKFDEALALYNKCLNTYKELEGEEGINVASTYNNIGIVHFHKDGYDFTEVLNYFMKALNIKTKLLGDDHRNVASIYNNVAALYQKTEKFGDALKYYELALNIEKKELAAGGRSDKVDEEDEHNGEGQTQKALHHRVAHDDVAQTQVHLAMIHLSMNNEEEALKAYQAAADTYLMAPKEGSLEGDPSLNAELAMVYFHMADLLQSQDDSESALEFLEKSLKIQKRVLGPHHLDLAHTYNMIADMHLSSGDAEACIPHFQNAREIYEFSGESDSVDMAILLSNLALANEEIGEEEEALSLYKSALSVRLKQDEQVSGNLPKNHPEMKTRKLAIADIYGHMGMLLDEAGDQDAAMEMYEKALSLRKNYRMSKDDDSAVADILHNICIVHRTRGDYLQALKCYLKSLPILRKVLGGESYLEIADTYINIGLMYRKMKAAYVELDPENEDSDSDEESSKDRKNAALVLKRGENHTESNLRSALEWFQKGLKVKIRVQGEKHPSVGGTHSNIANVHKLLGEHENALKAYEKDLKCSIRSFGAEHPHIKSIQLNIEKMKRVIKSKRAAEELAKKAKEKAEEAERLKILEENEESEYETDPEDNDDTHKPPTVPSTPMGDTRTPLVGSTANTTPEQSLPQGSSETEMSSVGDEVLVTPQTPVAPDTPAPSFTRPQLGNLVSAAAGANTDIESSGQTNASDALDMSSGGESAQEEAIAEETRSPEEARTSHLED